MAVVIQFVFVFVSRESHVYLFSVVFIYLWRVHFLLLLLLNTLAQLGLLALLCYIIILVDTGAKTTLTITSFVAIISGTFSKMSFCDRHSCNPKQYLHSLDCIADNNPYVTNPTAKELTEQLWIVMLKAKIQKCNQPVSCAACRSAAPPWWSPCPHGPYSGWAPPWRSEPASDPSRGPYAPG